MHVPPRDIAKSAPPLSCSDDRCCRNVVAPGAPSLTRSTIREPMRRTEGVTIMNRNRTGDASTAAAPAATPQADNSARCPNSPTTGGTAAGPSPSICPPSTAAAEPCAAAASPPSPSRRSPAPGRDLAREAARGPSRPGPAPGVRTSGRPRRRPTDRRRPSRRLARDQTAIAETDDAVPLPRLHPPGP